MNNLVNKYPMTNFHELNLDYIITLVRQNGGLHLEASGNQILLKSLDGTTISSITPHYAETAGHADTATSANSATFATSASTASSATTASTAGHALTADSATTAGTATTATSATTAGTATEAVHATTADTALTANTATTANTASYAETTGHVEHADKAIETITISGNTVVFKTYDNTEYTVTIPYAVKALKDSLGNDIKSTYVANVVEDGGVIKFKDAEGNDITSLTPTSVSATNDSYNNLIADFIKTITVSSKETEEALREPVNQIVETIHSVLEKTPPELAADIADRGIVLTGGGSLLRGLEELIYSRTGINTITAEDPMTAVAVGTGKYVEFLAGYRDKE